MALVTEEFGRYQGKILWSVVVEQIPGDWNFYGYRIKLGSKPVGASREHPEGILVGKYEKPADAALAGRKEAFRLAEAMVRGGMKA